MHDSCVLAPWGPQRNSAFVRAPCTRELGIPNGMITATAIGSVRPQAILETCLCERGLREAKEVASPL